MPTINKTPCVAFVTVTIMMNNISDNMAPNQTKGFCIGFNEDTSVVGAHVLECDTFCVDMTNPP